MVDEHEVEMTDAATPAESAETPAESAEAPAESAEAPAESAEAPAESAETPAESPEAPVETLVRVATGHDEIDAAMRRLDEFDSLPVDQHGEILDELHGRLRDALAAAAAPPSGRSDD